MLILGTYIFVSFVVFLFIYSIILGNLPYDEELEDLVSDKKIFYITLTLVSLLWVITMPIMIYNNIKH